MSEKVLSKSLDSARVAHEEIPATLSHSNLKKNIV